mgnify:CR=1 FL=1
MLSIVLSATRLGLVPGILPGECACSHGCVLLTKGLSNRSLDKIGLVFGGDKSSGHHNFLHFYEAHLAPIRYTTTRILEVGMRGGHSMIMWAEYFPCAQVHGWDINRKALEAVPARQAGAVTAWVDQMQPETLETAAREAAASYGMIIDDGWHSVTSMYNTLLALWPWLAPGGRYIIEDLHTCLHGAGGSSGSVGHSFGTCDQAPGQPTMFEVVLLLNRTIGSARGGAEAFSAKARRAHLPRLERWRTIANEVEGAFTFIGADCRWGAGGQARGKCGHVTAMLTKRRAAARDLDLLSVATFK